MHLFIVTLVLAATPAPADHLQAAAQLAEIRARFSLIAKARSLDKLAALVDSAPDEEAAAAAVWLGDLLRTDSRDRAFDYYDRAYRMHASVDVHRLAARGLGDTALVDGNYRRSERLFAEAEVGSTGVLAAELAQKGALAHRLFGRRIIEWAAWLFVMAVMVRFVWRARRDQHALGWPTELVYALPIYGCLVWGAVGRDAIVMRALLLCAVVSLLLMTSCAWAVVPGARRRQTVVDGILLVLANGALFFAVLNRMNLIDNLVFTVQM